MGFLLKRAFSNPRVWLAFAAVLVVAATFLEPKVRLLKNTYRYLFILDITQSMNTQDYAVPGMPSDRLSFVKQALRNTLPEFPCGSQIGLGIFSNKETLLLFEPIEVCENFSILDDVISHIDWRMAWAAESNIRRGLYSSIRTVVRLAEKPHLVFMTDGEPTIEDYHPAPLKRHAGKTKGIVVGVGGQTPAPIPKLDQENTLIGYWKSEEISILQNHSSASGNEDGYYLSTVDEANLRNLAALTKLHYHRLETPDGLKQVLLADEFADKQSVMTDIRWIFALTALVLVFVDYATTLRTSPGSRD